MVDQEDLVDLVSTTSEEEEEEEWQAPPRKKRPQPPPHSSDSSSSEDEEEDSVFLEESHSEAESASEFDEVFDLDQEVEPGFSSSAALHVFHEEEEEEDEEAQRFEFERLALLRDIKALDEEQAKLADELNLVQTKLASVQSRRDAKRRTLAALTSSSERANKTWSAETFPHSKALRLELKRSFGFDSFRELQLEAMNATLCGRDCFVVLPTGSGKSLLFQLPALVQGGITLVISPLLSLSRDQVYNLAQRGIQALMISSAQPREEINANYARLRTDRTLRLVYVTPEMMVKSKKFISTLEALHRQKLFARICIDEAHCCSTMGHDFRPDYQKLFLLRRQFPGVPILCVTATATTRVEQDVRETLNLGEDWVCFRASFNRANLSYKVVEKQAEHGRFIYQLVDVIKQHRNESGIVYCFSRKDTERIAQDLCNEDISARCYHSKVPAKEQERTHALWREGRVKIVVATTSFGMGIDMPNVRFVIHACLSTSMEGYVQESGRAGRDGREAECILLYRRADVIRVSQLIADKKNGLEKLREMIRYCENVLECRRVITGQCFGEAFDASKCNNKCDVCARRDTASAYKVDHTLQAENLLRRFIKLRAVTPAVTVNQLVDAWRKPSTAFVCPNNWTVGDCERLVLQLLLCDVFKLVWNYTSYSTNSYLEQGERARVLCVQQLLDSGGGADFFRIEYGVVAEDAIAGRRRAEPTSRELAMYAAEEEHEDGAPQQQVGFPTRQAAAAAAKAQRPKKPTKAELAKVPVFQSASKLAAAAAATAAAATTTSKRVSKKPAETAAAGVRSIKSMFAANSASVAAPEPAPPAPAPLTLLSAVAKLPTTPYKIKPDQDFEEDEFNPDEYYK